MSRGGRKSKKEKKIDEEEITSDDWIKDEKYDTESHLDMMYKKHLLKHSNK